MSAVDAFREQLRQVHGAGPDVEVRPGPPAMAIPGFVTLEATVRGAPVRGWARDDGAVVLFLRQNFGLLLDAARFADEPPGLSAHELTERLVWSHGPAYELVESVPAGELGLEHAIAAPVARRRSGDGTVELRFTVREREDGAPVTIMHYRLRGGPAAPFKVDLWQLAPEPDTSWDE